MTAWDKLIENSDAPDGSTAWEHLNSQVAGGGESVTIIGELTSSVSTNMESNITTSLTSTVNTTLLSSNITTET